MDICFGKSGCQYPSIYVLYDDDVSKLSTSAPCPIIIQIVLACESVPCLIISQTKANFLSTTSLLKHIFRSNDITQTTSTRPQHENITFSERCCGNALVRFCCHAVRMNHIGIDTRVYSCVPHGVSRLWRICMAISYPAMLEAYKL